MLQEVHSRVTDLTLSSSICHEIILSFLWSINFVNHETNHAVLKGPAKALGGGLLPHLSRRPHRPSLAGLSRLSL